MNLSLKFHTIATQLACWSAANPLAKNLLMLALPITLAVVASLHKMPTPPTGCTTGSGGC